MKLRIANQTHFSTRVMRSIILTVYRQVAKEEQRQLPSLYVNVGYARTWGQAHGALGLGRMSLFYRKSKEPVWHQDTGKWERPKELYQPSVSHVAADVRHELMHNYGYHHTMRGHKRSRFSDGWFYDRPLPEDLLSKIILRTGPLVPINVERPKPPKDLRSERHQRIVLRIRKWTAKRKRADTALKKLHRQLNYYERITP